MSRACHAPYNCYVITTNIAMPTPKAPHTKLIINTKVANTHGINPILQYYMVETHPGADSNLVLICHCNPKYSHLSLHESSGYLPCETSTGAPISAT